jgi:hypothetical protein
MTGDIIDYSKVQRQLGCWPMRRPCKALHCASARVCSRMPDPDHTQEDRGLKELFAAYPAETVAVFAPELLAAHGRPQQVEALAQELPLPDLGDPSRFLDIALLCTWPDGTQAVVLLIEHWSQSRKVDLRRVHWYYAALALRHPGADVLPIVLLTDRGPLPPDRLTSTVAGLRILDFQVRLVRLGPADLPRLRALQSRVAAVLMALAYAEMQDAVESAVAAVQAMAAAPGPLDDLRRFLPLALKLARMTDDDEPRFRRRMREEPTMGNLFQDIYTEGEASGEARGEARGRAYGEAVGKIALVRDLVAKGHLSIDAARSEIQELLATRAIPEDLAREALRSLG